MQSAIHTLASYRANPDIFGQRGIARNVTVKDPVFWDQYDNDTLIYDAIWLEQDKVVRLFFPKLLAFQSPLQAATWKIDSKVQRSKRLRRYGVYDTLDIPCDTHPNKMELCLADHVQQIMVNRADYGRFAGRNVLYTQIKDDDLVWIRSWVLAHQHNHGVDAVLIGNNNSANYTSGKLRETIADIDGIAVADVIDVPLRYGPLPRAATNAGRQTFLQTALQNIVHDRWMCHARGIILCDVDELVVANNGRSIFDHTAESRLKFTRFAGQWRYRRQQDGPVHHKDHIYAHPGSQHCPSKYCVVPNSVMGRRSWAIHSLEGVNRRLFPASRNYLFYHCRSISTSWKNMRGRPASASMVRDDETAAFMARTFSDHPEDRQV